MWPVLSDVTSIIVPSTMRPVLRSRAIRAASPCFLRRKRSRNDIRAVSLWSNRLGRGRWADGPSHGFRGFCDHAIAHNQIVVGAQDFVWARQAKLVIGERQPFRRGVVSTSINGSIANDCATQSARLLHWQCCHVGALCLIVGEIVILQ